jgi:hypothetical protein
VVGMWDSHHWSWAGLGVVRGLGLCVCEVESFVRGHGWSVSEWFYNPGIDVLADPGPCGQWIRHVYFLSISNEL